MTIFTFIVDGSNYFIFVEIFVTFPRTMSTYRGRVKDVNLGAPQREKPRVPVLPVVRIALQKALADPANVGYLVVGGEGVVEHLGLEAVDADHVVGDALGPLGQLGQVGTLDDARLGAVQPADLEPRGPQLVRAVDVARHVGHQQRDCGPETKNTCGEVQRHSLIFRLQLVRGFIT